MTRGDAFTILRRAAESRGYVCRFPYCWRPIGEITIAVTVVVSPWDRGLNILMGCLPTTFIVKNKPPHEGCWGISTVATRLDSPFKHVFDDLNDDYDGSRDSRGMSDAFCWLLDYQSSLWPNDDAVRSFINTPEQHFYRPVMRSLKDWAAGQLKTPQEYGMDSKYFGT